MSVRVADINSCFSVWHLKLVAFVEQEPILTGKQNDVQKTVLLLYEHRRIVGLRNRG